MKTTIDDLRTTELTILKERAQARFTAFRDAWEICKKSTDGKQIALQIWEEMEKVAEVMREQRRDVQKELLCQMLQIPKTSLDAKPIDEAYQNFTETPEANEFSELPTRKLNVPTKEQVHSVIKDLDSGNDENLVPFVKMVLSQIHSMSAVELSRLSQPLEDLVPIDRSKEEFVAEMSEKLGVTVELDSTLGDVARKIRGKSS